METKNVIYDLRTKMGLSQEELAEKVYVTRQAVSRWEKGETVPNTETLKLLSKQFNVSIIVDGKYNVLLGSVTDIQKKLNYLERMMKSDVSEVFTSGSDISAKSAA